MEEQKHIYVVLSRTPFGTGKLIRFVTGFPYNHSGVSLTERPEIIYTIARFHETTPYYAGFMKESVLRYQKGDRISDFAIFAVPVSEKQLSEVKERIRYFSEHSDEYVYNFFSAAAFPFRKRVFIDRSFTCLEFVLDTLTKHTDLTDKIDHYYCSIEELFNILLPYKIYEGSAKTFFPGAEKGNDPFFDKKPLPYFIKKGFAYNRELIKRFFRRKK